VTFISKRSAAFNQEDAYLLSLLRGPFVIAGAIHSLSGRSDGPFITFNCGAIPENLVDSELFGHEKGLLPGHSQGSADGLSGPMAAPYSWTRWEIFNRRSR